MSSHSHFYSPQLLTTTNLLSVSTDLLILDISYKWNHINMCPFVLDIFCDSLYLTFFHSSADGRLKCLYFFGYK